MTSTDGLRVFRGITFPLLLLAACSSPPGDVSAANQAALSGQGSVHRPANVPAEYLATPYGFFDPSCVVNVQRDEVVGRDRTIRRANGGTRTASACDKPRFDPTGRPMPIGQAAAMAHAAPEPASTNAYNGWLESYNTSSIGALSYLSATWVVPAAPAAANDGQTIYFFNGLEGVPTVESILQPVLTFSGGQWTATSWNCCASGTTFTGNTINVSPGDVIVGSVMGSDCNASTGLCDSWLIQTLDQTTNEVSYLQTSSWGVALNWVFPAVLEVYGVSTCSDLPASGSLTFAEQNYVTVSGATGTSAGWQLGLGSVTPSCGYGGQNDGSSVTLDFTGAGSAGVSADSTGNFAASCNGVGLQGNNVLSASCYNISGQAATTTIDLDTCVTNNGGGLAWNGGGYAGSCNGCSLAGTILTCSCYEFDGQPDRATIDLNDHVSNCNGVLTCGGCN
jgi:hypothetical protein